MNCLSELFGGDRLGNLSLVIGSRLEETNISLWFWFIMSQIRSIQDQHLKSRITFSLNNDVSQ